MTIISVIICSLGILANSLIIAVIVFSSLRTSVFMTLLMMLAISDNLCLLTQLNALQGIFGSIITPTILHCRFTVYIIYTSSILSSWITVLISVERYIAVAFPLKVHVYCTKTRTYFTLLLMVVLTCIGLAPILYSCSVTVIDGRPCCHSNGADPFRNMIMLSMICFLYSLLPFCIVTTLNILISKRIKSQNNFRARSQELHSAQKNSATNHTLVAMMMAIVILFAVTSFPGTIFTISIYFCNHIQASQCPSFDGWVSNLVYLLDSINHSINFLLYCVTGSIFRGALLSIFRCERHPNLPPISCISQDSVMYT